MDTHRTKTGWPHGLSRQVRRKEHILRRPSLQTTKRPGLSASRYTDSAILAPNTLSLGKVRVVEWYKDAALRHRYAGFGDPTH
jgi:hypothetical protein